MPAQRREGGVAARGRAQPGRSRGRGTVGARAAAGRGQGDVAVCWAETPWPRRQASVDMVTL